MKLKKMIKRFVKDERGLETSEYAIMLALIALALIIAITALKTSIANAFNKAGSTIEGQIPA